ncbi:MAG TPA: biotin--[acetyl-CoA-carboxylase] ligase [Bryobacteraceae bacterium]|nr:biotin--[acetyl-CoA-carboxylase] ligase [Bryobacteraceae bacterium]
MKLDIDLIRSHFPERRIEWRETTGSTMLDAARLAAEGCPAGTVAGAEEQTSGQGRYGRHWHSEPYAGLYQSIVLRCALPPAAMPVVTLALGLAVAEGILKATDLVCDLRWPNDLLLSDKKCGGILTQADGSTVIAGIGLNVNHAAFPSSVAAIATSLRIAGGRPYSREQILIQMLRAVDQYCELLQEQGPQPIIEMFSRASSYVAGRRVTVEQDGTVLRGVTDGLNESGFLMLREDSGRRTVILAGGVRPA